MITYNPAVKVARLQAVVDAIDAAAANGTVSISASDDTLLASLTLPKPCGVVAGGVLDFDFDPDVITTAVGNGTASKAIITDGDGTVVVSGLTVGTVGTDIILETDEVEINKIMSLSIGSLTHS